MRKNELLTYAIYRTNIKIQEEVVIVPRPKKSRKVCHYPDVVGFEPVGTEEEKEAVILTIDEYETIRLMDKEGYSQEQCGEKMQVARTTVQLIYTSAREKLAIALVEGRPIRIEGGDYQLCKGNDASCRQSTCMKKDYKKEYDEYVKMKGDSSMRIAVTYENGEVFQHFGHTEQFKFYDIEDGKVISSAVVPTNGRGHGALASLLSMVEVDVVICGGIGGGAQMALAANGIKLYGGVTGEADKVVEAFLAGELDYNPDVQCSHHGEHHGEGHTCGEHGCGSHGCGSHGCGH